MAVKHYHNHYRFSYNTSLKRHFTSVLIVIVTLFLIFVSVLHFLSPQEIVNLNQVSYADVVAASFNTVFRLSVAYAIALFIAIPLSLFITGTPKIERILLPIADVIQSVPILAFFPMIVLVFVKFRFFDGAAIFILFMAMLWNIVFTIIGGLKTIPQDITSVTKIFKATGMKKFLHVTLPSVFPSIITGSFLAWGQGWNISIVAEALHNYIPNSSSSQDLFGLGSLLVNSFSQGKSSIFFASLIAMILIISLFNFFVWQKLLHLSEKFKFD